MQLFVGVGGVCGAWCFGMKKGLRNSEGLCIHDGGDEGDRTPDLLTASQALSQLSYAPVTRRYYRGRLSLMQGLFWVESLTYGFSWDVSLWFCQPCASRHFGMAHPGTRRPRLVSSSVDPAAR